MSTPASSGGPSPLRVGGLALIGVGAVAALIGLATLLPGGGSQNVATPTATVSAAPTDGAAVPAPSAAPTAGDTGTVVVPSFGATPSDGVAVPGSGVGAGSGSAGADGVGAAGTDAAGTGSAGTGSAGTGGVAAAVVKAPLRVYNNSTIKGLAARAADDFRANGWSVDSVANYPSGVISTSTVYYRPGTAEQAAATTLGDAFGLRVEQRFTGLDEATPGLIVIVTNDYQRR